MMPQRKYWKKRFEQLNESLLNKGEQYYKDFEREYNAAIIQIEKDIEIWLRRLADNNGISLAEAKKLLKENELEEFHWSVYEYIKKGKENALDQRWMKELENASARVHISRYEALLVQIRERLELLHKTQNDGMTELSKAILKEGYYHTIYETQIGFEQGIRFAKLNDRVIEMTISKPWAADGKNFSDRIWSNKDRLISELQTNLTQSLIRGDAPDKAIKNISQRLKVSKKQAGRLVMTESAYFAAEGQKKAYEELEIEQYEIVATLDSHTSEICKSLDGKVLPMKDYSPGDTAPPFHCWCRTVTVPYFDDNFTQRAARRANDKTYYVDGDMSYNDWWNSLSEDEQGKLRIGRKKAQNYTKDKEQYRRYKELLGNQAPKSFDKFQELKYNDIEKWEQKKREYATISKIKNKKTYSDTYREKMINTYYEFLKEGYEFTDHSLNRFLGQKTGKDKRIFSKAELLETLGKNMNYLDEPERSIKYYNEIAVIQNKNTKEVVSIVVRKNPKKGWKSV